MLRTLAISAVFIACLVNIAAAQDRSEEIDAANAAVIEAYQASKYDRTLDLAKQVLTQAEEALGPDHPDTLISVNNLAALYESTERYGEAEPLLSARADGP